MNRRRALQWGAAAGLAGAAGLTSPAAAAPAATGAVRRAGAVRILNWNIYLGGRGIGPTNLPELLDQVVAIRPDVFLCVETYGSSRQIQQALSDRAGNGPYAGIQITQRPPGSDNLWIFTHLPVSKVFAAPSGGQHITDFNLGGARLRRPDGREFNVFDVWVNYTNPWIGYLIDENAAGIRAGLTPRHATEDVVHADRRQTVQIIEIVHQHLPAMLGGNTDPVVMGGDVNTVAAQDWTPEFADCPNHFGMSYRLTATKVIDDAGFADTYRQVHPDACEAEGRTWSPLPTERLITPNRIDLIYARGAVRVADAFVVDTRMPQHGPGTFYSDHAAVIADLDLG